MGDDGAFVPRHRLLLFSIAKGLTINPSTYDATRFAWRVNRPRAENVELALGCVNGIVKGVFVPQRRMEATKENFPSLVATHKSLRWGFEGVEADDATKAYYLGKRVPENLTIGQNGFRYFDDQASKRPLAVVIQTDRFKSA
jgi:hypothetical protein